MKNNERMIYADMLEKTVEEYLVKRVKEIGGKAPKWVSPGNTGVPDRIILLPGGKTYFVECKRPKGSKTSARQKLWRRYLEELGHNVRSTYTKEEVDDFISEVTHEV